MTDISPASVKELRERTGAGMMDCKKALIEAKGNFEEAIDWLRKKGLAAAAKKAGRVAAEGLVALAVSGSKGALIELNSETDFVARNDKFQALALSLSQLALQANGDIETLKTLKHPSGKTAAEEIAEHVATIGENLNLRRTAVLSSNQGIIASYMHSAIAPNLGKIGVLVALESAAEKAKLEELGKKLAMHIAASRPEAVTASDITQERVNREKQLFAEQAASFERKFRTLEERMAPHQERLKQKRSFSEKMIEAKLDELEQLSQNWTSLEDEDSKAKKLLDAFLGETAYLIDKVRGWGDTHAIIQKLVEIKTARFFEESALMDQVFVIDGKTKISDVLAQASTQLGSPVMVANFIRFQLGEGVEKQESDFAAEVAKAANG